MMVILFFSLPSFSEVSNKNFHDFVEKQLNNENLESSLKKGLKKSIKNGPNFNGEYYGFTYLCGSSHAICGVVFDPYELKFIFFPFVFSLGDVNVEFSKKSKKVCMTGTTSLGEKYNNKCFKLISGALTPEE